jgi:2,4-dienoyl-CoA reductase-like NADH-dependent reductase (Old Yellow Enzyme family)
VIYARELKASGADYVHVSSGGNATVQVEAKPGWQVPLAAAVRRGSGAITIAVGELGDPTLANATIEDGHADLVALGKTALREPHWPWRAARELGLKPSEAVTMPGPYGWCVGG